MLQLEEKTPDLNENFVNSKSTLYSIYAVNAGNRDIKCCADDIKFTVPAIVSLMGPTDIIPNYYHDEFGEAVYETQFIDSQADHLVKQRFIVGGMAKMCGNRQEAWKDGKAQLAEIMILGTIPYSEKIIIDTLVIDSLEDEEGKERLEKNLKGKHTMLRNKRKMEVEIRSVLILEEQRAASFYLSKKYNIDTYSLYGVVDFGGGTSIGTLNKNGGIIPGTQIMLLNGGTQLLAKNILELANKSEADFPQDILLIMDALRYANDTNFQDRFRTIHRDNSQYADAMIKRFKNYMLGATDKSCKPYIETAVKQWWRAFYQEVKEKWKNSLGFVNEGDIYIIGGSAGIAGKVLGNKPDFTIVSESANLVNVLGLYEYGKELRGLNNA